MKNVLYFSASWCQPCKAFGPQFNSVMESRSDVTYKKIDIDEDHDLAKAFNVRGVPTVIAFEDDKETGRASGAVLNKAKLVQLLG